MINRHWNRQKVECNKWRRTQHEYKNPSPQCCYQILYAVHRPDLLQCQELLTTYIIVSSDIYYGTLNLQLDWISSDVDIVDPFEILTHLPSIITTSIINFINAFHKYKPVPNREDLTALLLMLILVQVTHLNSHICHYGNYQDNCIDSTQESYESLDEKDSLEVTDY